MLSCWCDVGSQKTVNIGPQRTLTKCLFSDIYAYYHQGITQRVSLSQTITSAAFITVEGKEISRHSM